MLRRLPFWLLTADPEPVSPLPCCPPPLSPCVGLTNAWENSVAKNVDSLRICRFLLSIQFGGCEKRVENTFSLLASFFIFLLLFGQLCLRFVGEGQDRGRGSNTQRLFYIPFDCTTNAAGQRFVGSVAHSYSGCFLSSV